MQYNYVVWYTSVIDRKAGVFVVVLVLLVLEVLYVGVWSSLGSEGSTYM